MLPLHVRACSAEKRNVAVQLNTTHTHIYLRRRSRIRRRCRFRCPPRLLSEGVAVFLKVAEVAIFKGDPPFFLSFPTLLYSFSFSAKRQNTTTLLHPIVLG